MSLVRRVMKKLDYITGKTYMHGTMGTDPEVIKKEGLRTTRSTGRTDTAVSLHMYGEHPDNVFMTTKKKTALQYSGGDVGHVVKVRFPRSVHRALIKSGKLKRDSIETNVPELKHQQSWMHSGDVRPEYIHSIGKMKSKMQKESTSLVLDFLVESKGMKLTEGDLLNIKKKLPGGHTGYFDVDSRGEIYHKLIPKGMKYNQVKLGSRLDPKVVHPSISRAWLATIHKKYIPRAMKLADVTGKAITVSGYTPTLHRVFARSMPKQFVDTFGELIYRPKKRKLSISGIRDAASNHLRRNQESDRAVRIAGDEPDKKPILGFLKQRKAVKTF